MNTERPSETSGYLDCGAFWDAGGARIWNVGVRHTFDRVSVSGANRDPVAVGARRDTGAPATTKETERAADRAARARDRSEAFERERRARERESARLDAAFVAVRESRDPEDFADAPPATASARADLAALAAAALLVALVALTLLDLIAGPYQGISTDTLGALVEANFAYAHAYHESLGARLTRLAENVTRVEAGVGEAASLVAVLDNASAREALDAVNALTTSLENGGCVA